MIDQEIVLNYKISFELVNIIVTKTSSYINFIIKMKKNHNNK